MSVQVTLTFATVDDMLAHFAGKTVSHIKQTTEVAAAPVEKSKKSTSAATQASPAPSQPTAEVETAVPEKTAAESNQPVESAAPAPQASTAATDAPAPTYKDAAAAVTALSKKNRDSAIAVLKSFGAQKLPDVKPEMFADVIAACQAAMEA